MRPGENRLEERDFGQEIVAGELKFREDEINLYLSAGLVMGVTDRNRLRALCNAAKSLLMNRRTVREDTVNPCGNPYS